MRSRLVVVGASLAGLRAVEAARAAGWEGWVTLIGAEAHPPYDRPPLSKALLEPGAPSEVTPLRSVQDLHHEIDVQALLGAPATRLEADAHRLWVGDNPFEYDALVIATGSRPIMIPGAEALAGVTALRTHQDAVAVREALDRGARTVVIGAGFIGSEVASAARKRGLPVTIVEKLPVPLGRALGTGPGEMCADLHRAAGTELRLGVGVSRLLDDGQGNVTGVLLDDDSVLPADLVVVGVGVRPATEWLESSGIALHERDRGILCSDTLATSLPDVWAAGDVVHFPNSVFDGDLMRPEHWTNAAEQGGLAARNAVGTDVPAALQAVPYFWSDWYGHRLQFVGTPSADEVVAIGPPGPGALVLYRRGDRLVGTFGIDRQRDIMKFRRRILQPASWGEAVSAAEDLLLAATPVPTRGR